MYQLVFLVEQTASSLLTSSFELGLWEELQALEWVLSIMGQIKRGAPSMRDEMVMRIYGPKR